MGGFLIFHNITELLSVAVSISVFVIVWNVWFSQPQRRLFFLIIGVSSLFVGLIDMLHAMAYSGMNVFPGYGADLPTQLWIGARYLQSLSMLVAVLLLNGRNMKERYFGLKETWILLLSYAAISTALVAVIFLRKFPVCFVPGIGLTPFKKASEYAISLIFAAAGFVLGKARDRIDRKVGDSILWALGSLIATELTFTIYGDALFGAVNIVGHLFKITAFVFIFKGIVLSGMQRLSDSEQRYRTIVEFSNDAIILHDLDGMILDANDNACFMLGYSRSELTGMGLSTFNAGSEGKNISTAIARLKDKDAILSEAELKVRSGEIIPVEVSSRTVSREGPGSAQSFIRDIAELKALERRLEVSLRMYRLLSHIIEAATRIRSAGSLFEAICRIAVEEGGFKLVWIGLVREGDVRVDVVRHAGDGAGYVEKLAITVDDAPSGMGPTGLALKTGQVMTSMDLATDPAISLWRQDALAKGFASSAAVPFCSGGKVIGCLNLYSSEKGFFTEEEQGLLREISEEISFALDGIQAESSRASAEAEIRELNAHLEERIRTRTKELESLNAELNAFAYSVSHDLRAPLRGIDGFSRIMMEECSDGMTREARDYLEKIRAATAKMEDLIASMLDLANVSRLLVDDRETDLSVIAWDVATEQMEAAGGRLVKVDVQSGLKAVCDPRLMRIVYANLIGNAFKFTSKHPEARISIGSAAGSDGNEIFFVRDDGVGFDQAYSDRLFTTFGRLHSQSEFPGTGIGLATVARIVHRHGGRVWAESQPGQGASFYFTLHRE